MKRFVHWCNMAAIHSVIPKSDNHMALVQFLISTLKFLIVFFNIWLSLFFMPWLIKQNVVMWVT